MEKKWLNLYTSELDVIERALWELSLKRSTNKKTRETCNRIIKAIKEKDEAYLVY